MATTREPQYQPSIELRDGAGFTKLGLTTNWIWDEDPIHMVFLLSRYKFVARQLQGTARVLEVGCADGFASRIVRQFVGELTAVDFDSEFVANARQVNQHHRFPIDVHCHDMLQGPPPGGLYDAAYSLDVLEHIEQKDERTFLDNLCAALKPTGTLIIGMPSLESQIYASPYVRHVNCKKGPDLTALMKEYFHGVFPFSMNDEVVHTGYAPMAHYRLVVCSGRK